jgi:hypothetical protein
MEWNNLCCITTAPTFERSDTVSKKKLCYKANAAPACVLNFFFLFFFPARPIDPRRYGMVTLDCGGEAVGQGPQLFLLSLFREDEKLVGTRYDEEQMFRGREH